MKLNIYLYSFGKTINLPFKFKQIGCNNCGNYSSEGEICEECSSQNKQIITGYTYMDYYRFNLIGKFIYNRIYHFQDLIKQFQGKQNCKIPDKLYQDLDKKFKLHGLLVDSNDYYVKHSKITKEHIYLFLKELKYFKHYENINIIYYILTNKSKVISEKLEKCLINDFKQFIVLYDEIYNNNEKFKRKNFINIQYILYQFLKKYDYDCDLQDFTILKTAERRQFHDNICSNLFKN